MKNKLHLFMVILLVIVMTIGCTPEATEPAESGEPAETEGQDNEEVEPIELKMGTKMSEESIEGMGHQYFAEIVKEKSGGQIEVVIYPSEQLGDSTTQVNNVLNGAQDIYAEGLAFFANYAPQVKIENLPYLFTSEEQFKDVMEGDFGKGVEASLEENGFKLLSTERSFARGPYRVLCSTKPVTSLEDMQGLRLRLSGNAMSMNAYAALGAAPIKIAWTETYLALKQGTVDAVTSPISLVYNMKFTEVAPYVAYVNEFPQYVGYVINGEKFNSLTAEQQQLLIDCANEAGEYATQLTVDSVGEQIELMKTEHNAEFTEIDTVPFREKLMDHYLELDAEGTYGEGVIKSILGN